MTYVVINGMTVKCAKTSMPRVRRRTRGRMRVGITGDQTEARRASKWGPWEIATPPMNADEAESLEAVILGRAHVWDCNGSFASSGAAGIRASSSANKLVFAGGPFPDAASITIASGTTTDVICGLTASRWTALVVAKPADVGAWGFYGFASTGNYYLNGAVQGAASLGWFARQANGDGRFTGKNNAGAFADLPVAQIVACNWLMPTAQLAAFTAWMTRRWGPSPQLDLSGSFLPPTAVFGRGKITISKHRRGVNAGGYRDNLRELTFTLMEA
jgi:hypothetical protein